MCLVFVFFFFFSSRRRHTRCLSDWSSDVCSSDLSSVEFLFSSLGDGAGCNSGPVPARTGEIRLRKPTVKARRRLFIILVLTRSEERRVGKEGGSRWWQGQ